MKVIILCGGLGSRIGEETKKIPKPMIKIGKIPILLHIMNIYSSFENNIFIYILLGPGCKSRSQKINAIER